MIFLQNQNISISQLQFISSHKSYFKTYDKCYTHDDSDSIIPLKYSCTGQCESENRTMHRNNTVQEQQKQRVKINTVQGSNTVSNLVLWSQSTTKDFIRAKNKLQSVSYYSAHKSSNHWFSKVYTISPVTDLYQTKSTDTIINCKIFEESVSYVLPLLKKHILWPGLAGIVDPSTNSMHEGMYSSRRSDS